MEPRSIIRSGIAASAVAHLSLLAALLAYAEVHPFGAVTAEPIAVDIVSPEEAAPPPVAEPPAAPKPADAVDPSPQSAAAAPAAPAAPQPPAAKPQKQKQAALAPPSGRQQPGVQPAPAASPAPAFVPPQPDLSIKYHVLLGLPPPESPAPKAGTEEKGGDDFDAPASATADIASGFVREFRSHLKTCAKLPQSVAASDQIRIKLRVWMTPEGKLAAAPVLIEASASAKGPALMQSAISALEACQPYAMLPVDRYGEWKALDLNFTPHDFAAE